MIHVENPVLLTSPGSVGNEKSNLIEFSWRTEPNATQTQETLPPTTPPPDPNSKKKLHCSLFRKPNNRIAQCRPLTKPSQPPPTTLACGQIDDVVDAVPVHGFCGAWGVIAASLFATKDNCEWTRRYLPVSKTIEPTPRTRRLQIESSRCHVDFPSDACVRPHIAVPPLRGFFVVWIAFCVK